MLAGDVRDVVAPAVTPAAKKGPGVLISVLVCTIETTLLLSMDCAMICLVCRCLYVSMHSRWSTVDAVRFVWCVGLLLSTQYPTSTSACLYGV